MIPCIGIVLYHSLTNIKSDTFPRICLNLFEVTYQILKCVYMIYTLCYHIEQHFFLKKYAGCITNIILTLDMLMHDSGLILPFIVIFL